MRSGEESPPQRCRDRGVGDLERFADSKIGRTQTLAHDGPPIYQGNDHLAFRVPFARLTPT